MSSYSGGSSSDYMVGFQYSSANWIYDKGGYYYFEEAGGYVIGGPWEKYTQTEIFTNNATAYYGSTINRENANYNDSSGWMSYNGLHATGNFCTSHKLAGNTSTNSEMEPHTGWRPILFYRNR